jgi:hypothetical protein
VLHISARIPLIVAAIAVGAVTASAEEEAARFIVTGVAPNDVLHVRDVPSADSRSIGTIPPAAHGLQNLGCLRKQASLDDWVRMTAAQRADSKLLWCRVEYKGTIGWVAGRFLKQDSRLAR